MEETLQKTILQPYVELERDSKGAVKFTVKAYADTVEEAEGKALKVFEHLIEKYKRDQ